MDINKAFNGRFSLLDRILFVKPPAGKESFPLRAFFIANVRARVDIANGKMWAAPDKHIHGKPL